MKKIFKKSSGCKLLCAAITAAILSIPCLAVYAQAADPAETSGIVSEEENLQPPSGYAMRSEDSFARCTAPSARNTETEASGNYGSNISWTLSQGTLTISGQGKIQDTETDAFAPWYEYRESISRLVLENGITAIGTYNFYECTAMTEVTFPDTLTEIGEGAFLQCSGLTGAALPDTVSVLGMGAFADCTSMTSFSGKGVTEIPDYAFQGSNLAVFEVPVNTKEISSLAFYSSEIGAFEVAAGNTSFRAVDGVLFSGDGTLLVRYPTGNTDSAYVIPTGCTTIGEYAFQSGESLESVDFQNVTTLEEGAFYLSSLSGSLVLSDKITTINGSFHFKECRNLTSVTFGKGLKETSYCMFEDCSGLQSIDFGDTLQKLGMRTFHCCSSLTEVTLPDRMTEWGGSVLNSCENLVTFRAKNLKEVTYADFAQCYQLQNVYLGNVEKIYRQAFTHCDKLKEVTLPASTTWVDENAFPKTVTLHCLNKELVPFGNNGLHYEEDLSISGTRDYEKAFQVLRLVNSQRAANGLPALHMEETLLDNAMVRAAEQAILFSHTRPDGSSCFSINPEMYAENVAAGSSTAAGVMDQWMNSDGHRANILLENAKTIGIGCFCIDGTYTWVQVFSEKQISRDCARPANRTVTETVGIARDEFSEAATSAGIIWGDPESYQYKVTLELQKKTLAAGEKTKAILRLVNPGFSSMRTPINASSVKWSSDGPAAAVLASGIVTGSKKGKAVIKGSTKYFSAQAKLTVKAGTPSGTKIEDSASGASYKVTKMSSEVAYIGIASAKGTVKVPNTVTSGGITYKVTSLAPNAFKGNKKVTKVRLGANVRTIGKAAFAGCTGLKSITINKKLTAIGAKAFYNCTSLKKITIPGAVDTIGKQAFAGCKNLKTIAIKTSKLTAKKVGKQAFRGIARKAKITVPKKMMKSYRKLLKARGVSKPVIKAGK